MAPFQNGQRLDGSASVAGPYDEVNRALAGLSRPRPLRISRRGKVMFAVVSIALAASLGIFATAGMGIQKEAGGQSGGHSQFPANSIWMASIVLFVVVMLNMVGRQKRLLSEGEIASAHVTDRWSTRNGPAIRYEFTTPLGESFSRNAPDGTRQLSAGMIVPVFYDAQSPKKQLALCASFYEVVLSGEK